jgi:hypothetical protein
MQEKFEVDNREKRSNLLLCPSHGGSDLRMKRGAHSSLDGHEWLSQCKRIIMFQPDRLPGFLRCKNHHVSTRRNKQHPIHIFAGTAMCRLQIWNDSEWMALPSEERPSHHAYVLGLGWVAAVPVGESE